MNWKLGVRYEVLPGDNAVARFANAARYGFDAVELPGRYLSEYREDLLASLPKLALPISSLSLGFRGSLVSSDAEVRKVCQGDIRDLLDFCAKVGATGLVMPPVLHMDPCPRVKASPDKSREEVEDHLLLEALPELAQFASDRGVRLMLEPVNSMETDYMTTVAHAARICDTVAHDGLGITIDFFHMQTTELDTPAAIEGGAAWIRHVHVAENTRVEPGPGQLNFAPGFEALRRIGYDGSVVVECRSLSGPADEVLPMSAQYLRGLF
jgi:sugar phosphate isomerase/epimerase